MDQINFSYQCGKFLQQSGSSSSRPKRKDVSSNNSSNNRLASNSLSGKTETTQSSSSIATSDKLENSNDAKVVKQMPRIPKTEDISNIFDKQRENIEQTAVGGAFGKGGSLGFGFRGTIPKLPSFKVKIKA